MVRIEGLRKSFGDLAVLNDVNLDVMPGEVVTIIGASGSGKSTLLRCINLLETPDAGSVWFQGKDLTSDHVDVNRLREDIGMVFQGFNLFNNMDVLDNCTLAPVTLKKLDKREAERVALGHLESVGLADFARASVQTLSGGQRKRVAIARALCMSPKIMLFDEPTSALDPEIVGEVLEVMRRLAGEGMTMVVVTHEIPLRARCPTAWCSWSKGVIAEQGDPERVHGAGASAHARVSLSVSRRLGTACRRKEGFRALFSSGARCSGRRRPSSAAWRSPGASWRPARPWRRL